MLSIAYMVLSLPRDYTNPNLPAEQKGRSSQVRATTFSSLFVIFPPLFLLSKFEFIFIYWCSHLDMVILEVCKHLFVAHSNIAFYSSITHFILHIFGFSVAVGFPQVGAAPVNVMKLYKTTVSLLVNIYILCVEHI